MTQMADLLDEAPPLQAVVESLADILAKKLGYNTFSVEACFEKTFFERAKAPDDAPAVSH